MSTTSRTRLACIALSTLLVAACKKDEAELTADWNRHIEDVQKYAAKYPGFKAALDARLAEAQKTFDQAKTSSDPGARTAKIAEANANLTALVPSFEAYETAHNSLKTAIDKHASLPPALAKLGESAKGADTKATQMIADAKPGNIGEAKATLESATTLSKDANEVFSSADGYLKASDELKALTADKDILKLPAGQVVPLLDAAKQAQAESAAMIAAADPASPGVIKTKVGEATRTLDKASAALKKAKPAPQPAAPSATAKPTIAAKPAPATTPKK